jgi:hypothetical protein
MDPKLASTNQITVSVTVEQSQVLVQASGQGRLSLTLRNPDDIAVLDGLPETTATDIIEPARRAELQRRTRDRQEIERVR